MRHSFVVGLFLTVLTLASVSHAQTQVSTAAELVSAVQTSNATPGPEVIILAPGTYALGSELVVTDELEIRAPGEARGCDFLPLVPENPALGLSEGLGGSLCDGDAGEAQSCLRSVGCCGVQRCFEGIDGLLVIQGLRKLLARHYDVASDSWSEPEDAVVLSHVGMERGPEMREAKRSSGTAD